MLKFSIYPMLQNEPLIESRHALSSNISALFLGKSISSPPLLPIG